jgi:hypothetical protein
MVEEELQVRCSELASPLGSLMIGEIINSYCFVIQQLCKLLILQWLLEFGWVWVW